MSGFSLEWLAMREPFDAASRSRELAQRFAAALRPNARIVDIGGGTGANMRYLAPLTNAAHWSIVDSDATLLASARASGIDVQRRDLTGDLAPILDACTAVTTSALLDLCSAAWLDRLADALAERQLPFFAALSVDGRIEFDPPAADDAIVVDAFARHQRSDKGFGPALGAQAGTHIAERLTAAGYDVTSAASDWRIGPGDAAMMRAYLDGVIEAAAEAAADERARITVWAKLRLRQTDAGRLAVRVGHRDMLGLPARRRA